MSESPLWCGISPLIPCDTVISNKLTRSVHPQPLVGLGASRGIRVSVHPRHSLRGPRAMLVAQRSHSALSKEIRPSLPAAPCHHVPSIPVLPGEHRPPAPGQSQPCILSQPQAPTLCISPSFSHHLSPPHFPYLLSSI